MTTSIQKDALLSRFSVLAYKNESFLRDSTNLPTGWTLAKADENSPPFAAFAFKNDTTGEVVIAYRGTDGLRDGAANAAILAGRWDPQFQQGMDFTAAVQANRVIFPLGTDPSTLLVTGHSLGGAIAQVSAQAFGLDGSTIDPGAASRIVQTAEFRAAALAAGLPLQGLGAAASFSNYLVADNLNGIADSGRELFSDGPLKDAVKGVQGLAWVDANADGVLDAADPVFAALQVWQDVNRDNVQDVGETKTLAQLNITKIDYNSGRFTRNGQDYALQSPDLETSNDGVRVNVMQRGIQVSYSTGQSTLFVTEVADMGGGTGKEDDDSFRRARRRALPVGWRRPQARPDEVAKPALRHREGEERPWRSDHARMAKVPVPSGSQRTDRRRDRGDGTEERFRRVRRHGGAHRRADQSAHGRPRRSPERVRAVGQQLEGVRVQHRRQQRYRVGMLEGFALTTEYRKVGGLRRGPHED